MGDETTTLGRLLVTRVSDCGLRLVVLHVYGIAPTAVQALRDSYDIAQLLEVLAFGLDLRPAPEPEQPPQGAAGGGGGRRRSKAAARNGQPTETDMPTVRLKFKGYMAVAVVKLQ